jgi:CubicO group peptidase (beta-lactamase class C family)
MCIARRRATLHLLVIGEGPRVVRYALTPGVVQGGRLKWFAYKTCRITPTSVRIKIYKDVEHLRSVKAMRSHDSCQCATTSLQPAPGGKVDCDRPCTHIFGEQRFEEVVRAFDTFMSMSGEMGAAFAIYENGREIVGGFGGRQTAGGPAWKADTLTTIWSCGKPVVATCLMGLVMDGVVELDERIVKYWPEFGALGKDSATVRMALNHTLGLPTLRNSLLSTHWDDWRVMTSSLAASPPEWQPGSRVGYHPYTFGWLIGELVQRISGKSLRDVLESRIAAPLSLPIWIGAPRDVRDRISPQIEALRRSESNFDTASREDSSSLQAAIDRHPIHFVNSERGYDANLCAANMVSSATGMAAFMDALLFGSRLIDRSLVSEMTRESVRTLNDATFLTPACYGLGVMRAFGTHGVDGSFIIGDHAFGHVGAGGHFVMADEESGITLALTISRMAGGLHLDSRGQSLIDALYRGLGYRLNSDRSAYTR